MNNFKGSCSQPNLTNEQLSELTNNICNVGICDQIKDCQSVIQSIILEIWNNEQSDITLTNGSLVAKIKQSILDKYQIKLTNDQIQSIDGIPQLLENILNLYGQINDLDRNKQNKSDDSLTTTNKTIVGAINELKNGQSESVFFQNAVGQIFPKNNDFKGLFLESNGQLWPAKGLGATEKEHFTTLDQLSKKNSLAYSKADPTIYFQSVDIERDYEGVFTFFNALKNDFLNQDRTFINGAIRVMPDSNSNAYMVGDFKYFNLPNANQVLEINLSAANWPIFPIIGTTPQGENVEAKSLKIKINQQAIIVSVEQGNIGSQNLDFKNYFSVSDLQISNLISSFRYYIISFFAQNYGEITLKNEE